MRTFFLIFLLVPLVEIYFLITVGGIVGAAATVALVVLTALIGATLVRAQGVKTFTRFQAQLARGKLPEVEMLEGVMLLVAGALLLTPGFFTDAAGFVLLTPPLRRQLINRALARRWFATRHRHQPQQPHPRGRVIDINPDHE